MTLDAQNGAHLSGPELIGRKPESLLPVNARADRPLFLVMMIMVFLACLSAIATHASYRAAGNWGDDLKHSATVQIKPGPKQDGAELTQIVTDILVRSPDVKSATPITRARARALLRPWLGNAALPESLPVPYLVDISLKPGTNLDIEALARAFDAQDIRADIDDHGRWSREIARTAAAAQAIAVTALILLVAAATATAGFATQAGLAARRTIIGVLVQVGARNNYIAHLFTVRFAWLGLKAGTAGALLAAIVSAMFWFFSGHTGSPLLPGFSLQAFDVLLLCSAPFVSAVVCALAARYTVISNLKKEAI